MTDSFPSDAFSETSDGLAVLGCLDGSPAARAGIRSGDVIFEVNGRPIAGPDSYMAARGLDKDVMHVRLRRGGAQLDFLVPLAGSKLPAINAPKTILA